MRTYTHIEHGVVREPRANTQELATTRRRFDIKVGDTVKILDNVIFIGTYRRCEVISLSYYVVACRDLKTGTRCAFSRDDYIHGRGIEKVGTK